MKSLKLYQQRIKQNKTTAFSLKSFSQAINGFCNSKLIKGQQTRWSPNLDLFQGYGALKHFRRNEDGMTIVFDVAVDGQFVWPRWWPQCTALCLWCSIVSQQRFKTQPAVTYYSIKAQMAIGISNPLLTNYEGLDRTLTWYLNFKKNFNVCGKRIHSPFEQFQTFLFLWQHIGQGSSWEFPQ